MSRCPSQFGTTGPTLQCAREAGHEGGHGFAGIGWSEKDSWENKSPVQLLVAKLNRQSQLHTLASFCVRGGFVSPATRLNMSHADPSFTHVALVNRERATRYYWGRGPEDALMNAIIAEEEWR